MNRRSLTNSPLAALALAAVAWPAVCASAQQKLHFTYLWHMEQPIYWPDRDRSVNAPFRYELAWPSIQQRDAGQAHPTNNLRDIFGLADRQAGYQYRMRDSINAIRWSPEAGAQISYSGGLIENVTSLGNANQLGYSPNWFSSLREARGWTTATSNPKPRADIVQFGFHHPLMPLVDSVVLRKELQVYRSIYPDAWGSGVAPSRGLFPSEMAFSTRMIEALAQENIAWVIVSAEKLSRACSDFPVVYGSGGINTDPPNKADQLNPAQGASNYYRVQISRGCAPAEAYPFSLTPRRARYVNPDTGSLSQVIVIPAPQALSWEDGYAPMGLGHFNNLQTRNDGSRPMLLTLTHDGDNAWGGGYSYYMEATPNLVSQASAAGYVPSTVEQYLQDHPVPANDYVHVEDGAWINADGDFGSPQYINWNWPLLDANGQIDPVNGWHIDPRNWAIITAATNRVQTAEQIVTRAGGPQPSGLNTRNILYPQNASTTPAERAWHFLLGSLNSGYMYYGNAEDFEVKPTIACNEAVRLTDPILSANPTLDATGPTIWSPQRQPWNPGSVNFGPQYGYRQVVNNGDFHIWTFVHDVSGVQSVTLKYRVDADGARSLSNTENETYAGGPGVGAWQSLAMAGRAFPKGNVYNDPTLNLFELPDYIADHYVVQLTGLRSKLIDYYVEAVDNRGNIKRSPIQHVWIGEGSGSNPGGGGNPGDPVVTINPAAPIAGQTLTVTYNPAGRPLAGQSTVNLHNGFNGWTSVTTLPMTATGDGKWTRTITLPSTASSVQFAFTNGSGIWDNNGGGDWSFNASGAAIPFVMDGTLDQNVTPVATSPAGSLYAALRGNLLYLAAPAPVTGQDAFLYLARTPGTLRAAQWGKAGQVAGWDAFIGSESTNSYIGWFDAVGATQIARGGVIEGTIDLAGEFGSLPESVYAAFARFNTPDAGALLPATQIPAAVVSNGALESGEYVRIQLCSLTAAGCCPTDYNRDGTRNLEDLSDFITDFYTVPAIPGGLQPAAPTFAESAIGFGQPCPEAANAPAPYAADAYRTQGYRAGFSADGSLNCPPLGPNLENLSDFITAFYGPGC
jgi:hypothetical protein